MISAAIPAISPPISFMLTPPTPVSGAAVIVLVILSSLNCFENWRALYHGWGCLAYSREIAEKNSRRLSGLTD